MEHRTFGRSGLQVSVVGLGCNNFGWHIDLETSRKVIHTAIDLGITLFDTADVYGNMGGSETILGHVLGERRNDIILASKFGMAMGPNDTKKGGSRRHIMRSVEESLRRLRTDWIDLYQLHRPDPLTPIEETMRALDDLIASGKVRYIGCSNLPAWQVVEAQWTSRSLGINAFISCQDEYSLVVREAERELIPAMEEYGMGMLPYFPLASGLLTGKYSRDRMPEGARLSKVKRLADRYFTDRNWAILDRLNDFCAKREHRVAELAIAWLASRPTVSSVIAGATMPEQVEDNVRAVAWKLSPQELSEVDSLTA